MGEPARRLATWEDLVRGPGGWWLVLEPDVELEAHEIVAADSPLIRPFDAIALDVGGLFTPRP